MGEGSVRAGLCDRPFSRKIRNGGGGASPNDPCGMAAPRGGGFSRAGESRKMEADASAIGRLS